MTQITVEVPDNLLGFYYKWVAVSRKDLTREEDINKRVGEMIVSDAEAWLDHQRFRDNEYERLR